MKITYTVCLALLSLLASCSEKKEFGESKSDTNIITKDFSSWWSYQSVFITLSSDFVSINEFGKQITKKEFLKKLTSGNYIPIELESFTDKSYYKLFELDASSKKDIGARIKNEATTSYTHYKLEGTKFPDFNFTDINGVTYTSENTKGKTVVIKCWFIACKACVSEFPELNKLVDLYKNNNNVVFISLAIDSKEKLGQFVQKKPFKYSIVPNQESFMSKDIGVFTYPTHYLINKEGKIEKVVNTSVELLNELGHHELTEGLTHDKNIPLSKLPKKRLPPPPPM